MARDPRPSLDLFADRTNPTGERPDLSWPDASRFPVNLNRTVHPSVSVAGAIYPDLHGAVEPLIVTGYAGLDQIITFVLECTAARSIRVLFGSEPFTSRRETFELEGYTFHKEVEAYWLNRGISLQLSAQVIRAIDELRSGRVQARYLGNSRCRLHAKIYCAEGAATLGSSNFTRPGMHTQLEANARFSARTEGRRHRELRDIAENYWSLGTEYTHDLIALLERLLQKVKWQEALARACAELLEGEWAQHYMRSEYLPEEANLWPSQRQGIAQALYVLTSRGSVLIADATGSGKTRMGVHIIGALADHTVRCGRFRRGKSLMVCPPIVASNWEIESTLASVPLEVFSHGILSRAESRRHEITLEALRRAQIVSIDEGHNFLNIGSVRTQNLLRNMADYVLVFTATPLNRSVRDLLRIADVLGADNLDDSTLAMFRKLLALPDQDRPLLEEDLAPLRREIKRFTVRRTKRLLNRLIDREPDQYLDRAGRRCRFPRHEAELYPLEESAEDRRIAGEIRRLADGLQGATYFQQAIEMPDVYRARGLTEEQYLRGRLTSARKIARFVVMKSLRSSRLALAEHIAGTHAALAAFDLRFQKRSTGNMLSSLKSISGKPPVSRLQIVLPAWLSDPAKHAAACEHDYEIYERIYALVRELSDGRERCKAGLLVRLVEKHGLILAFDSRPITLAEIRRHIQGQHDASIEVVLATGDRSSERDDALERFALGAERRGVIGLCSDSLSEGVNLQQAAALVHLDMPSVVRIAEQRVGRIDRLDSPHATIEAWWPNDAEEFALSSDERFIERYETVDALLGANMPLPEDLRGDDARPLDARKLVEEYEEALETDPWDGLQDAFEPVRALISGPDALVEEGTYEYYRRVAAKIVSRVSLVHSDTPWAFFCVTGGEFNAPRWTFFESPQAHPLNDLEAVCGHLRTRLTRDTQDVAMDAAATALLQRFLGRLDTSERLLLPTRKQRALEEMEAVVEAFAKKAAERCDQPTVDCLFKLLDLLKRPQSDAQPDWTELAARWMDLIRPTWYERLKEPRTRPLLLREIRRSLIEREVDLLPRILKTFRSVPILQTATERISACIIGVP